jgi:hypothetical protein
MSPIATEIVEFRLVLDEAQAAAAPLDHPERQDARESGIISVVFVGDVDNLGLRLAGSAGRGDRRRRGRRRALCPRPRQRAGVFFPRRDRHHREPQSPRTRRVEAHIV